MTSNRGAQFTSAIWSNVAYLLGVQLHRTTAYHSQSNGLVDRFHRTMKTYLKARLTGPNYIDELPESTCCCCLPTLLTLGSGGSPIFPLEVH